MKKSLLALAALGAFAGAAHAQSSVTLYGIIDAGFNYQQQQQWQAPVQLSSGVLQGCRWGLRGTEDLGGGLKALFVLENGFDVNNGKLGQGGAMFGRQAYVGLSSQFGTVTLGRQYDSVVDYVGPLEVGDQWGGYFAAHPGDLDNLNNSYRTNNTVKYTSANYGGLTFGGTYSFGGMAGNYRNQIFSAGAGYNNGPLVLGVGYLNVKHPGVLRAATAAARQQRRKVRLRRRSTAATRRLTRTRSSVRAVLTRSAQRPSAQRTRTSVSTTWAQRTLRRSAVQSATFNNGELNFKYQLTPALLIGAAYDYTRGAEINGNRVLSTTKAQLAWTTSCRSAPTCT